MKLSQFQLFFQQIFLQTADFSSQTRVVLSQCLKGLFVLFVHLHHLKQLFNIFSLYSCLLITTFKKFFQA